jgi:hypothetical protein
VVALPTAGGVPSGARSGLEADCVAEYDEITAWKDRADSSEKRDRDLQLAGQKEHGPADVEQAEGSVAPGQRR